MEKGRSGKDSVSRETSTAWPCEREAGMEVGAGEEGKVER